MVTDRTKSAWPKAAIDVCPVGRRGMLALLMAAWLGAIAPVAGQNPSSPAAAGPWGISSSAGSSRTVSEWFPKISAIGITTARMFPEWRELEPVRGTWKWQRADALVEAAAANKIEINAILMGSPPGDKK